MARNLQEAFIHPLEVFSSMLHVFIGALAGAVLGAGSVVVTSLIRGKPIDWKAAGSAALGGAAVGAIGSLTFGAGALATTGVAKTAGMVAAGASGGALEQATDNLFHGRELAEGVKEAAIVGGALGAFGAGARKYRKPLTKFARNKTVQRVARDIARRGKDLLARGITAMRNRARSSKVNLSLGRRQPRAGPASRRSKPAKRALAPFAARLASTRAGQATKRLWGRYLNALSTKPGRTRVLTSVGVGVGAFFSALTADDEPTATVGTTTRGPQARTQRVSNEREADLKGMIDVMVPSNRALCEDEATACR